MYKYRLLLLLIVLLGLGGYVGGTEAVSATPHKNIHEQLRARFEDSRTSRVLRIGDVTLHVPAMVARFYQQRDYQPAWSDANGPFPLVDTFIDRVRSVEDEGLNPQDYHLRHLERVRQNWQYHRSVSTAVDPAHMADLDVLLSDAFLTVASHLVFGRFPARKQMGGQDAKYASVDLVAILQRALDRQSMTVTLRELVPSQGGYDRLRQALARYRHIAAEGGWSVISAGPALRQGVRHERVRALRQRLRATGELAPFILPNVLERDEFAVEAEMEFDGELDQAVRLMQSRHGLQVDGVVGPKTLAALNVPVETRIRQIALNLDRWRQQARDFGERYLVVNIPAFTLDVIEHDQSVMSMRVVVGKPKWRTPIFQATMTYLVINPYWSVPRRISRQEIVPKVLANPEYLRAHNMQILQGQGAATRVINPSAVDWSAVTAGNFPYRFRQRPGTKNALGHIKFKFPNAYSVYMHDTPARSLFAKPSRAFSHGCVRLEKPVELAAYLLQETPAWTAERVQQTIRHGSRRHVDLPHPIEVHMVYRTAWVDEEGSMQFRPDIYGHDQIQRKNLNIVSVSL